jgi:hypothetical protein
LKHGGSGGKEEHASTSCWWFTNGMGMWTTSER